MTPDQPVKTQQFKDFKKEGCTPNVKVKQTSSYHAT